MLNKLINKLFRKNSDSDEKDDKIKELQKKIDEQQEKINRVFNGLTIGSDTRHYYIEKNAAEDALDFYHNNWDRLKRGLNPDNDRVRELMADATFSAPRENKISIDERNLLNSKLNYYMDRMMMLAKEGKKKELKKESLRIEKEISNDPDFILETADKYIDWFDDELLKNYREKRPDKLWWFRAYNIYKQKVKKEEDKKRPKKSEEKRELERIFHENETSTDRFSSEDESTGSSDKKDGTSYSES